SGVWLPVSALLGLLIILSTLISDGFHEVAPSQASLRAPVAGATSIAGLANSTEEPIPFPLHGQAGGSRQTESLLPPGSTPDGTQESQTVVPPISVPSGPQEVAQLNSAEAAYSRPAQAEVLSGTAGPVAN